MSDHKTAIGVLDSITEKTSGWHRLEIKIPGKDYTLKLDTKLGALVEQARATGTQTMEWTYSESDSGTPNPNRPGSNYINRRLEKVGPASAQQAAAQPADVDWDEKQRRDLMSRAWAQAISALEHTFGATTEPEDPSAFFTRLQAFQRKIYYDVTGEWGLQRAQSYLPPSLQGSSAPPEQVPDDIRDMPF